MPEGKTAPAQRVAFFWDSDFAARRSKTAEGILPPRASSRTQKKLQRCPCRFWMGVPAHVSSDLGGDCFFFFLRGSFFFGLGRFRLGLFQDALDGVGRKGAELHPMSGALELDGRVVAFFLRIVGADKFEEFAVTRTMLVRHHDAVVGTVFRAVAPESDDYCHKCCSFCLTPAH